MFTLAPAAYAKLNAPMDSPSILHLNQIADFDLTTFLVLFALRERFSQVGFCRVRIRRAGTLCRWLQGSPVIVSLRRRRVSVYAVNAPPQIGIVAVTNRHLTAKQSLASTADEIARTLVHTRMGHRCDSRRAVLRTTASLRPREPYGDLHTRKPPRRAHPSSSMCSGSWVPGFGSSLDGGASRLSCLRSFPQKQNGSR